MNQDSSVSKVTGCELGGQSLMSTRGKNFSLHHQFQIRYGSHPFSHLVAFPKQISPFRKVLYHHVFSLPVTH